MDRDSNATAVPQTSSLDKSRVLDVKPLRTLVPMFPSPPEGPPFVCSSPFGPFSPGFSPFYPFSVPQGDDPTPSRAPNRDESFPSPATAVPLRSFGTPHTGARFSGISNGDTGSSKEMSGEGTGGRQKRAASNVHGSESSQKRKNPKKLTQNIPGLSLSPAQLEDGSRELVNYVMLKFDAARRRISQLEDAKGSQQVGIRRPDLKAGNTLMTIGIRTNSNKRVGPVPGVEIGDIFFFRIEMCVVGLNSQSMAGIDYMTLKGAGEEEPVAVSIVSSGTYDDEAEHTEFLIYTGQGGNLNLYDKDKGSTDQKLVRGNLAMEKSFRRGTEIRVVRGIKYSLNPLIKIYVYDGLYIIEESWIEKGKSAVSSFKYKMVRVPGQPSAFGVWQSIEKWKQGLTLREGLILPDLTSGIETTRVSLVNDVDGERGPSYFTYTTQVKYLRSFSLPQASVSCNCQKDCSATNLNCGCICKNGGDYPYTTYGVLVSRKPMVYECGVSCSCPPNCKNRVSQTGLRVHLEVFKTKDRGWGLRSLDPIRAGTFIFEYVGEVIEKTKYDKDETDDYAFDTSRTFDSSFKWNCDPELIDDETPESTSEEFDIPTPLVISAKELGNVARFMNHSCSPNVFWQLVAHEKGGEFFVHVAFFAICHIPPMTELTYDYGLSQATHRRKQCLCGSSRCRGHFG